MTASDVVDKLIAEDEGRDVRQLAIIDVNGNVKSYTGKNCIPVPEYYWRKLFGSGKPYVE